MSCNAPTKMVGSKTKKISEMSRQQRLFVKEYMVDLDPVVAYHRAGYKGKGDAARASSSMMMRTWVISKAIDVEMKKLEIRIEINADNIMAELAKIGFDEDENYRGKKNSDKIKALHLMGKHIGMFKDQVEIEVTTPNLILSRSKGVTIENEDLAEKVLNHLPEDYTKNVQ